MTQHTKDCEHPEAGYNAFGWGCPVCGISGSMPMTKLPDGTYIPRDHPAYARDDQAGTAA